MLKRFSRREKLLMGLLALIIAYYLGVQLPVSRMEENLDSQKQQVAVELDEAVTKTNDLARMQTALESYRTAGSSVVFTPNYDNTNNIIVDMNAILGGSGNYSINFGEITTDGQIVRRSIDLQFTAASFNKAVKKLKAIERSHNGYLLGDTSITYNSTALSTDSQTCTVVVHLTSFEYKK